MSTMSDTRFETIVSAYGAQPQHWPEAERAQALLYMQQHPEAARRLMAEARTLDAWLAASAEDVPSAALQWAVLGQMVPQPARAIAPVIARRKVWLAGGIGLAAACAAGIIFGVNLGLMTTSEARADEVLASASLNEAEGNW